jgi:hypothetical protein
MGRRGKQDDVATPKRADEPEPRAGAARTSPRQSALPIYDDPVDDTLDDSFPASDPPSWAGR